MIKQIIPNVIPPSIPPSRKGGCCLENTKIYIRELAKEQINKPKLNIYA